MPGVCAADNEDCAAHRKWLLNRTRVGSFRLGARSIHSTFPLAGNAHKQLQSILTADSPLDMNVSRKMEDLASVATRFSVGEDACIGARQHRIERNYQGMNIWL